MLKNLRAAERKNSAEVLGDAVERLLLTVTLKRREKSRTWFFKYNAL